MNVHETPPGVTETVRRPPVACAPMFGRRAIAATVLAGTMFAACGGTSDDSSAEPTPEPAAAEPATSAAPTAAPADVPSSDAPVAVPAALDITAPLLGGGEIELGQYAGRPVLLWFWAPW